MDKKILLMNIENGELLDEIKALLQRRGYEPTLASEPDDKNSIIDKKITRIFIALGISAKLKGYIFLREAIKFTIEEPDIINNVTTKLYPSCRSLRFGPEESRARHSQCHRNGVESRQVEKLKFLIRYASLRKLR